MNQQLPQRAELGAAEAEVLEAQIREDLAAQRELLETLREKERLLIKQDLPGLEGWIAGTLPLFARIDTAGEHRRRIFGRFGKDLGLGPAPRLAQLVERAGLGRRPALVALRADLVATARAVFRQNQRNALLARESISLNDEIVRRIFSMPSTARTYDAGGQAVRGALSGTLDRRA